MLVSDLFMRRSAVISPCKLYRYTLSRVWDDGLPVLVVCMLNPSTADDQVEDPTLLALIHFAKLWGYGGLLIVNLYAYRSSSPAEMMKAGSAVGPDNGLHMTNALVTANMRGGGRLLAAWGNGGNVDFGYGDRAEWFRARARLNMLELICLGTTMGGSPKHPMARGKHRTPRDQQPIVWAEAPTA